jgi:hypothetical protein
LKRKILSVAIILGLLLGIMVVPAQAVPEDEVREAIEKGVEWLANQQGPIGGWWGDWERCAVTALAIKKLEHHAVDSKWGYGLPSPFHQDYPYREHVILGLEWLLEECAVKISLPEGPWDTDGDGWGVYFGMDVHHRTYSTACALMALCEAGPDFADVTEDTMNYLAWAQTDEPDWGRGGWGYAENGTDWANQQNGWSDQSNTGYATLALGFYEAPPPLGFGGTVPQFVKDELNVWIANIQNADGGSAYTPGDGSNILRTGNLLQQMAFVGDNEGTPRVKAALSYMANNWYVGYEPGWRGQPACYQATFTAMKGFTSLGLYHEFGEPPIPWQEDFETVLLEQQLPDGDWPRTCFDSGDTPILSTIWALLTLQKVAPPSFIPVPVDIKPTSCPNPLNTKSQGVLPVAILGTEEFDVTQINPATVRIILIPGGEKAVPLRWAMEDVATPYEPFLGKEGCMECNELGRDGFMDLTVKFRTQEVVALLGEIADGDCVVLKVTALLKKGFGGTLCMGEDVVRIILKSGGKK